MSIKTAFLFFAFLVFIVPVAAAQNAPDTYKGYACTKDCSGHKAGYAWAQEKSVISRDECGGKSHSFVEGCYSWVEEQENTDEPSEGEEASDPDAEADAP